MTTTVKTDGQPTVAPSRLATYGLLVAILASLVNALVRVAATTLFDVPAGVGPLGWAPVVVTTVVGVAGATVGFGLLARVSTRPKRDFAALASVVLLLSFVPLATPPTFLAAAPASVLVTLGAMHVTTAVIAVVALPRATATGAPSR